MPPSMPSALCPGPHEHGLASGSLPALADTIDRAWELFEKLAADADMAAPSRREGWNVGDIIGRIGVWDGTTTLADLVRVAHEGDATFTDPHETDEVVRAITALASPEEIRDSIARAREATSRWLATSAPTTWGLVHTSSPLGPLPVLTVVNAMTYQMSIAALDVEVACGPPPEELLDIGLVALVDVTGALAGRKAVTATFTAVTPSVVVGVGSDGGHWRTAILAKDTGFGPAAMAPAEVILDVTSGRAPVAHLYRTGELQVRDLSGMIRLAPVLEGVPGLPPLGAVGRAIHVVDAVGGLLGRLRR